MERNAVAKLVTAIPYLGKCGNPDRSAVGNITSSMAAKNPVMRSILDNRSSDYSQIMSMLRGISHFQGGDRRIIQNGGFSYCKQVT